MTQTTNNENSERELLPCPFCGTTWNVGLRHGPTKRHNVYVSCRGCNVTLDLCDPTVDEAEAIKAWNTRSLPPQMVSEDEFMGRMQPERVLAAYDFLQSHLQSAERGAEPVKCSECDDTGDVYINEPYSDGSYSREVIAQPCICKEPVVRKSNILPGQFIIGVKAEWIDGAWKVMGLDGVDEEFGQLHRLFTPSEVYSVMGDASKEGTSGTPEQYSGQTPLPSPTRTKAELVEIARCDNVFAEAEKYLAAEGSLTLVLTAALEALRAAGEIEWRES